MKKFFDKAELFFEFLNDANDMIFVLDIKSKTILYANKKMASTLKYTNKELKDIKIEKIRKKEDNKNDIQTFLNHLKEVKEETTQSIYTTKENKKIIVEVNTKYLIKENIEYNICVARDITKKIEEQEILDKRLKKKIETITNQKNFLDILLQNNPTAIFYKDKEGKYLGCNKTWEKLTGIKAKNILGKSVFEIAPLDIAQIYHEQDEKVFNLEENPQTYKAEIYNKLLDKRFDVVFYKSAYFDSKNNVVGLIGVVIDITQLTKLEKEKEKKEKLLYQQSKMASMGEMIENIAHQWRQPLSIMTTSASGIKIQKEFGILKEKDLEEFIEAILSSAKHLSQTIDDFRNFFRSTKDENSFYIDELLKKALNLLSAKMKNHDIEVILQAQSINIKTYENELLHVLINILSNAVDALDKIKKTNRYIFIDIEKQNSEVIITIKDNANGIEKNIIDKIFEPYFTTKHQSHGTGIGLYMSREIILKHLNGNIEVTNSLYEYENHNFKGAKFIIKLPIQ